MLLGLSSLDEGDDGPTIDVNAVGGSEHGNGGVADGALLTRFAEAVHAGSGDELAETRSEVVAALGADGLVDAAAICANFTMMVRIADGTGTPLDEGTVAVSADLRADLGLDDLTSRRLDPG